METRVCTTTTGEKPESDSAKKKKTTLKRKRLILVPYVCSLTEGSPQLVQRISRLLVQVDVVPEQLDVDLLAVLRQ